MEHSFLQSYEWERFQESVGKKTWRVEGHLVVKHDLPKGFNYLYAPHLSELSDEFLHEVRQVALREKSLFLKVDPFGESSTWKLTIKGWQFSHFLQPRRTIIIDLTRPEEDLLSDMHSKTRYNIKLAEKHGVGIIKCPQQDVKKYYFDIFWDLLTETSHRDIFSLHSKEYYQHLLAAHGNDFSNTLFFAEYRGKPLAVALINYYKKTATSLHGASAAVHRDVMAPNLLHWRVMQDAKQHGFTSYDLWGIDEEKWPGVTRFKQGLGGNEVKRAQSFDIVFRPMWYKAYKILRKF